MDNVWTPDMQKSYSSVPLARWGLLLCMRLVGSFSELTQLFDAYDGLFTNRAPFFHTWDAFVLDLGVSEAGACVPPPFLARI
jgi:hypothetical protein